MVAEAEPDILPKQQTRAQTRAQGGLKPPVNSRKDQTKNRKEQRGRPQRDRRMPKRFNKEEFVTDFTFTVPASQLTYL